MNLSFLSTTLLAQISRWERLGDGLHRSRGRVELLDLWPLLVIFAVIATGIAVAAYWFKQNDFSKACDDPQKLFRQLCRAHSLDRRSRRILNKLAECFQLTSPADVFLTPTAFEASQLPGNLRNEEARIAELRQRLF